MENNQKNDWSGNLCTEVDEMKKVVLEENDDELAVSVSRICGGFLTIYCC